MRVFVFLLIVLCSSPLIGEDFQSAGLIPSSAFASLIYQGEFIRSVSGHLKSVLTFRTEEVLARELFSFNSIEINNIREAAFFACPSADGTTENPLGLLTFKDSKLALESLKKHSALGFEQSGEIFSLTIKPDPKSSQREDSNPLIEEKLTFYGLFSGDYCLLSPKSINLLTEYREQFEKLRKDNSASLSKRREFLEARKNTAYSGVSALFTIPEKLMSRPMHDYPFNLNSFSADFQSPLVKADFYFTLNPANTDKPSFVAIQNLLSALENRGIPHEKLLGADLLGFLTLNLNPAKFKIPRNLSDTLQKDAGISWEQEIVPFLGNSMLIGVYPPLEKFPQVAAIFDLSDESRYSKIRDKAAKYFNARAFVVTEEEYKKCKFTTISFPLFPNAKAYLLVSAKKLLVSNNPDLIFNMVHGDNRNSIADDRIYRAFPRSSDKKAELLVNVIEARKYAALWNHKLEKLGNKNFISLLDLQLTNTDLPILKGMLSAALENDFRQISTEEVRAAEKSLKGK
ncbi:MAG: hypothetical protein PHW04_01985 [Candidatus Wallbacteria bacterium]|nr:hypothetical protein [Candidatus Wallbacteria bacterium]